MRHVAVMTCALIGVTVAWSGFAAELRPLDLKPDCGYVFNPFTGTPPGFDAMTEQLIGVILALGFEIPVTSWQEADVETVGGVIAGDGIPDHYQLGMLGAALCAGDPLIVSQFNANKAEFTNLVANFGSFFNAASALVPAIDPTAAAIADWAAGLPEGYEKVIAVELVALLEETSREITTQVGTYSSILTTVLPLYQNWFAAIGGLDSGLRTTLNDLLDSLYRNYTSYCWGWPVGQGRLSGEADYLNELAQTAQPPMTPQLAAQCAALRDQINNTVLPAIWALQLPDMVLYGTGQKSPRHKALDEPFAADGDYNSDDVTNQAAYNLVTAAGGDRFDFVQAAAGNNPFWQGNPALPALSVLGLALLTGISALGGIRGLRRSR